MSEPLKKYDHFDVDDVIAAGSEAWTTVRELAKGFGFNVSKNFGSFNTVVKCNGVTDVQYFVGLDKDGDFMCSRADSESQMFSTGRLRTMSEFIKPTKYPHVKIRVNGNKEILSLAVEELRNRGYNDDKFTQRHLSTYTHVVGVIGGINGSIVVAASEEMFTRAHKDADELLYDVNRTITLDNIRVKPKLVNVSGVMCELGAFQAFLDAQRKANPQ